MRPASPRLLSLASAPSAGCGPGPARPRGNDAPADTGDRSGAEPDRHTGEADPEAPHTGAADTEGAAHSDPLDPPAAPSFAGTFVEPRWNRVFDWGGGALVPDDEATAAAVTLRGAHGTGTLDRPPACDATGCVAALVAPTAPGSAVLDATIDGVPLRIRPRVGWD